MQYIITFLEGIMSFLSPCMLPLLPLYVSYFSGEADHPGHKLRNALCFVLGFTLVFCALGVFAGTLGSLLARYHTPVDLLSGCVVILFGLSYLEIVPLPFFRGMTPGRRITGAFSAFVFGLIYSVSLTPCVGAFLGSALMLASSSATVRKGLLLLLVYSLGLGIPFVISAVLIGQLQAAFSWVKSHYKITNRVCGLFLILVGLLIASGQMNRLLSMIA